MLRLLSIVFLALLASPAWPATYYVTKSGSNSNTCNQSQTIPTARLTIQAGLGCLQAGDTLLIGDGTYVEAVSTASIAGTGTSSNRITIQAINRRQVIVAPGGAATRGITVINSYVTVQGIVFNCASSAGGDNSACLSNNVTSGINHVWIIDNEFYDSPGGGMLVSGGASNWIIEKNTVHENGRSTSYHNSNGMYLSSIRSSLIRYNEIYQNECNGIRFGNSTAGTFDATDNIAEFNYIHNNGDGMGGVDDCGSDGAGIMIGGQRNTARYNVIAHQYRTGIWFYSLSSNVETDNVAYNNTIYNVSYYGIAVRSGVQNSVARNNHINTTGLAVTLDQGTGTTFSNNRTTGVGTDCWLSSSDFRLKPGTNPCREAGTAIAGAPASVDLTDMGAFEQGRIVSATVAATGFIEATVSTRSSGLLPAEGITGFSLVCGTCTGTPVVTGIVKPGSNNVVLLSVTGIATPGTATLSYNGSTGNLTDGVFVGTASGGFAQGINTVSGLAISGTVDNSAGGSPPVDSIVIHYPLDEGTGATATDAIGSNDGTIVGSPTWQSPAGLYFPNDGVDRSIDIPYGAGVNVATSGLTFCGTYTLDNGVVNKVLAGAGTNGTDQRFYFGTNTGATWQLGVQATPFTTIGQSEFPVQYTQTRICLGADPANDLVLLVVDGVMGTSAASRVPITSYALASDLVVNCGPSPTSFCGGFAVKDVKIWNKFLTQQEFTDDYLSFVPEGGSVGGYAEVTHRCQRVYLDANGDPIAYGAVGSSTCDVVAGGAVAIEFQVDCTGGACGPLAVRLHASDIAGNTGAVPQELDAFGLAMWKSSASTILNRGVVTCCLSGALTQVDGVTILDSVASNTIELAEDSSTMFRFIVRVADNQAGETFSLFLKQDNGASLDGAAGTTPQIRVIAPQASGGF